MFVNRRRDNGFDIIERMAEPDYLRRLRKQAEKIEKERQLALQDQRHQAEAERLRNFIRNAGHTPFCCATARNPGQAR